MMNSASTLQAHPAAEIARCLLFRRRPVLARATRGRPCGSHAPVTAWDRATALRRSRSQRREMIRVVCEHRRAAGDRVLPQRSSSGISGWPDALHHALGLPVPLLTVTSMRPSRSRGRSSLGGQLRELSEHRPAEPCRMMDRTDCSPVRMPSAFARRQCMLAAYSSSPRSATYARMGVRLSCRGQGQKSLRSTSRAVCACASQARSTRQRRRVAAQPCQVLGRVRVPVTALHSSMQVIEDRDAIRNSLSPGSMGQQQLDEPVATPPIASIPATSARGDAARDERERQLKAQRPSFRHPCASGGVVVDTRQGGCARAAWSRRAKPQRGGPRPRRIGRKRRDRRCPGAHRRAATITRRFEGHCAAGRLKLHAMPSAGVQPRRRSARHPVPTV